MRSGNHFFNFIKLDIKNPSYVTDKTAGKLDFTLISNLPVPISVWQKIEGDFYLIYKNNSAKKLFGRDVNWGIKLDKAFPVEYQNILSANSHDESFYQKIDDDLLLICHYLDNKNDNKKIFPDSDKNEQSEYQKIIETSPVSVIITDILGNIEYVNPKFLELTGYTESELLGKNPSILKGDNKSAEKFENVWETILSGKVWKGEFTNKKKNGEIFYEYAVISPIADSRGKIKNFIAFKEDVTKLKAVENELNKSEKFATLGKIMAYVSHQIKTPLSSIKVHVDLLQQDPLINDDAQKSISVIQKEIKRLTGMLNEVLRFSDQPKLYLSEINLSKNFENIHTFLKPLLKARGIKLNYNTPGHKVYGDAQQLRSLFLHLLENSIESMDIGGEIEISSSIENDDCHIFIKDTGCGINDQKDIFEPFFTTKSCGSGFGLSIAKNIVEKHKGQIKLISSRPGETIFEIILPAGKKKNGKASHCR